MLDPFVQFNTAACDDPQIAAAHAAQQAWVAQLQAACQQFFEVVTAAARRIATWFADAVWPVLETAMRHFSTALRDAYAASGAPYGETEAGFRLWLSAPPNAP